MSVSLRKFVLKPLQEFSHYYLFFYAFSYPLRNKAYFDRSNDSHYFEIKDDTEAPPEKISLRKAKLMKISSIMKTVVAQVQFKTLLISKLNVLD